MPPHTTTRSTAASTTRIRPSAIQRATGVLAVLWLVATAFAQDAVLRYDDPSGLFSLTHPSAWTVTGAEGNVELYGEPIATFIQVSVFPIDMVPTSDVAELAALVVAGWVETWEDAVVEAANEVEIGGLAMHATAFEGIDTSPIRVERRGALHLAVLDTQVVMVVHMLPTLVADEVMPEIEAVLASLGFAL